MKTNSAPAVRASRLPRLVALGPYAVARDYWNDAGRLYLTSSGDAEHAEWKLLGEALSVYPAPLWQTVTLDFPRMGGINSLPYARLDASSLVRRLVSRGFVLDLGKALPIAGLLWSLYGGRVALSPQGYQTPAQFWADRAQEQASFLATAVPASRADAGRCASW